MKFTPLFAFAVLLPVSGAAAGPFWPEPSEAGERETDARVTPVQWGFEPVPEAPLREYTDDQGNRIFVDQYGEVVSVVPPAGVTRQPDYGQRGRTEWGERRLPGGGVILEGPVEQGGYGGYRQPVEPDYGDYRDFPPPPVERAPLGEPQYGATPQYEPAPQYDTAPQYDPAPQYDNGGPRPYTPPTTAGQPPAQAPAPARKGTAELAALQVFLDRAGASPGVIDGQMGSNVRKAMEAYTMMTGVTIDPADIDTLMGELQTNGGLPIQQYTITPEDVAGPFIAAVPTDYAEKALLPAMSYTSAAELLAERFHMDEGYLRAINPNADFGQPGTVIKVANVARNTTQKVTRIVADKTRKQIFAYDESGGLIVAYPATIGSQSTPSPTGTHKVERIAIDPEYTYNPKINFKQGENDQILRIPPGPNGPVGAVWIALSKPTYGIHGTPEPSAIGKTESNGCIRLTNWDAKELAKLVSPGVTVEFIDAPTDVLVSETTPLETQVPAQGQIQTQGQLQGQIQSQQQLLPVQQ